MSYYPSGSTGNGGRRILAMVALVVVAAVLGGVIWSSVTGRRNQTVDGAAQTPEATQQSAATPAPDALDDSQANPVPSDEEEGVTYTDVFGDAADIIAYAKNAVVNVLNYQGATQPGGGFIPNDPEEQEAAEEDDLVGFGSGVIISEDGYIVTNYHVVEDATALKVTLYDGTAYDATVVGSDEKTDLALLKIEATGLTALAFGDSTQLRMGDLAITMGYLEQGCLSCTAGIISSPDQQVVMNNWPSDMLQIDAAINPGNSGGALVNGKGELIGINTLKKNYAGIDSTGMLINADGIGFAIPSSEAMTVISDLKEYGYVRRPTIGITGMEVSEEVAQYNDVVPGILVSEISAGSGAEKAGLQVDDIVTGIDGHEVTGIVDINQVLHDKQVGDTVELEIWRDGQTQQVTLTLGEPENPNA